MAKYMEETEARKRISSINNLFDARLFIPQGYRSPEKNVKMLAWLVQQEVSDFDDMPTPRTKEDIDCTTALIRGLANISLGFPMALHNEGV